MMEIEDTTKLINPHDELDAMKKVTDALEFLDDDAIARVLVWVGGLYGISVSPHPSTQPNQDYSLPSAGFIGESVPESVAEVSTFDNVADLYYSADPTTDTERALVMGYWFQECQGQPDFDSFQVNSELKHLGHRVANITTAFDGLQSRRPAFAIQTRKSGASRQSRKRYKITHEGVKAVHQMIKGGQFDDD